MNDELKQPAPRLKLKPVRGKAMPYGQFLKECSRNPELSHSVWERLVARIKAGGVIKPTDPYLRALKVLGIDSYKVFEDIRGSERTVHAIFNQALKDKMVVLLGPPGSGKTKITKRLADLLRGQEFFVVDGCPTNEPAINLLRLFESEDEVRSLAPEFGPEEDLVNLWKGALPPCKECFERAFGKRGESVGDSEPSLDDFKVSMIRLDTREGYGISIWTAQPSSADAVPLKRALSQGSHLCILRDPFAAKGAAEGAVPQTHILLQAVQEKYLDQNTPYSGLVFAETNQDAWREFRKLNLDPGAYIRRSLIANHGYNLSVSRETMAYRDLLASEKAELPQFDPFALEALACLAVSTRLKEKLEGEMSDLDLATRMRIYDGDLAALEMFMKKKGLVQKSQPQTLVTGEHDAQVKEWCKILREAGGPEEGFDGLNMSFMLFDVVNPLRQIGLAAENKRLSVFGTSAYLQDVLQRQLNSSDAQGNTSQKELYERCLANLKWVRDKEDSPALVERHFRHFLREAVEHCFCPEAELLKDQLFWQYFQHAKAKSRGAATFEDEHSGKTVNVSDDVLSKIEDQVPELRSGEDKQKFRGSLRSKVKKALELTRQSMGDSTAELEASWQTIPELKTAIAKLHTEEILAKIKLCLASDTTQLDEKDETLRLESRSRFKDLGYSDKSADEALRYYINFELWRTDDRR